MIHIAETIPDPEFLKSFLKVIQNPASNMDDVCNCFQQFAKEKKRMCYIRKIWCMMDSVPYFTLKRIPQNGMCIVSKTMILD